jgi:hypothetical protein
MIGVKNYTENWTRMPQCACFVLLKKKWMPRWRSVKDPNKFIQSSEFAIESANDSSLIWEQLDKNVSELKKAAVGIWSDDPNFPILTYITHRGIKYMPLKDAPFYYDIFSIVVQRDPLQFSPWYDPKFDKSRIFGKNLTSKLIYSSGDHPVSLTS